MLQVQQALQVLPVPRVMWALPGLTAMTAQRVPLVPRGPQVLLDPPDLQVPPVRQALTVPPVR